MTAFGTVGAVIAAVGIAVWSDRTTNTRVATERAEADRRLHVQLDHSDAQLRQQQEHSDQQLAEERAAADERVRRDRVGFVHAWVERDSTLNQDNSVRPPNALHYVARNDGSLPVYSVVLLAPSFYEPDERLVMANISVGMLVPGQVYERPAPAQMNANFTSPSPIPVVFTDSKGDRWVRDNEGKLAELGASNMDLDRFAFHWDTALEVNFKQPGIQDRMVLFFGQAINIPQPPPSDSGNEK